MKQNKRTHLHGQRGQAFADRMRGIPAERVLCASMDVLHYWYGKMWYDDSGRGAV